MILDAFNSLGKGINKVRGTDNQENQEGIVGAKFPELTLDMENSKLIDLTKDWEKKWKESEVFAEWKKQADENEKYWKGKHLDQAKSDSSRPDTDNAIFEALETYLPQATRRNPEVMAEAKGKALQQDKEAQAYAADLQSDLADIADELVLRLKLKKAARHWALNLLGVGKIGWDLDKDIPKLKIVRVQKLILDPDATVDEDGYTGEYVGEHRELQASVLIKMLEGMDAEEGAIKAIQDLVKEDLGTNVGFIEFWTDQYMCWTMGDQVLVKKKNIHWNYDKEVPIEAPTAAPSLGGPDMPAQIPGAPAIPQLPTPEAGAPETEGAAESTEAPEPQTQTVEGINHFKTPKKPYFFLSVFNLGTKPVDDTSLIGQNLSSQDRLNKRNRQIDNNVDNMNGGIAVSLEKSGLTGPEADRVAAARRKGGVVAIPAGAISEAIQILDASALPADVFNQVVDTRNRIKDIFGTRGSSAAGLNSERTVRGKILNQTTDTDRIGGGFSEYLEQFADNFFNYAVQMLYVYNEKYANGQPKPPVTISIKEGSLLPKDSTTIANQAIELSGAGKMSTMDLYKRLDYPNPEELAANVWLEANAPDILYSNDPRVAQVLQAKQQAQGQAEKKAPSQSINFKDLPPEAQAQMLAEVGIHIHPEGIAAHNEMMAKAKKESTPPAKTAAPAEAQ